MPSNTVRFAKLVQALIWGRGWFSGRCNGCGMFLDSLFTVRVTTDVKAEVVHKLGSYFVVESAWRSKCCVRESKRRKYYYWDTNADDRLQNRCDFVLFIRRTAALPFARSGRTASHRAPASRLLVSSTGVQRNPSRQHFPHIRLICSWLLSIRSACIAHAGIFPTNNRRIPEIGALREPLI